MSNFQKPNNNWLCFLSLVWVVAGVGYAIHFAMAGLFLGAGAMAIMGIAGVGLWFQSRLAAWAMIAFAIFSIGYALLNFGKMPLTRVGFRLCFGIWTLTLLVEYLNGKETE